MTARILVADDDDLMRTFIVLNLETIGVKEVVEATNGLQAWSLVKQHDFDLVLIDWHMPGKSGLEIIRQIRSHDSEVPILMVTAEAVRGQVLEALQSGATDYLVKPFEADKLRAKVVKLLEKKLGAPQK
ncbi:MAG: response regulator [Thermoguttaceae bacterium]|jgi:two-component system chemotaxis response regulator CheY